MYGWALSGRKWKIKSEIISKFTFQVYHGAPVLPAHMIYCGSKLRLWKLWVFKELDVMDFRCLILCLLYLFWPVPRCCWRMSFIIENTVLKQNEVQKRLCIFLKFMFALFLYKKVAFNMPEDIFYLFILW